MLSKIKTPADLNQGLRDFLASITAIGASSRGNQFDETVREQLRRHLPGAHFVSASAWSNPSTRSPFFDHRKHSSTKDFNFTGLDPVWDNGVELNLMIIDKPNGSQQWPDLLVVFNGVGLPIEVKSGKSDAIVWNSGLPKDDSLYIFNCYGKSRTTCFLGQHIIDSETRQALQALAQQASEVNQKVKNWDFYSRKMFNSHRAYFEDPADLDRKEALEKKLATVSAEFLATDSHNILDPRSERVAAKVNQRLASIRRRIAKIDDVYRAKRAERLAIEGSVQDFVQSLPWDARQRCDFGNDDYTPAAVLPLAPSPVSSLKVASPDPESAQGAPGPATPDQSDLFGQPPVHSHVVRPG